jgi:hypothetical protein
MLTVVLLVGYQTHYQKLEDDGPVAPPLDNDVRRACEWIVINAADQYGNLKPSPKQ